MRTRLTLLALWSLSGAPLVAVASAAAGENKENAKEFRVEGELTTNDGKDKVQQKSYHKVHTHKLLAGKTYRIDLIGQSPEFDAFLRLEDPSGKQLAADDD